MDIFSLVGRITVNYADAVRNIDQVSDAADDAADNLGDMADAADCIRRGSVWYSSLQQK